MVVLLTELTSKANERKSLQGNRSTKLLPSSFAHRLVLLSCDHSSQKMVLTFIWFISVVD